LREPGGGILVSGRNRILRFEDNEVSLAYGSEWQVDRLEPWKGDYCVTNDGLDVQLLRLGEKLELVRTLIPDLPESAFDLTIDSNDTLWLVLPQNGIYATSLEDPNSPPQLAGLQPSSTFALPPNEARFFVLDDAVYVYNEREIHQLDTAEPFAAHQLPGVGLTAAERRGDGEIWATAVRPRQPQRLVRLTAHDGTLALEVMNFPEAEAGGRTWSISRAPDSPVLWLGGTTGVIRTDRTALKPAPEAAAPVIFEAMREAPDEERLLALDQSGIGLPFAREGTLRFEIRSGHDILRERQNIESRLAGAETRWTPVEEGSRSFTGLREGTYTLEVREQDFRRRPGPVSTFSFEILPPWHRSGIAYAAYLAAFAAVVYGGVRWRLKRIARLNTELERLVNARTEELTRAVAARSAFLATMGHEIRNPLNGVIGLVDALSARKLEAEQRSFVERIGNCANQLVVAVEDVLEFARIDAGRIPVRLRPFLLRESVEGAIDIFRASDIGTRLELHASDSVLHERIVGDPDRIRQVLVNYIANAIKFGGGSPVVVAVSVRDGFINLSVSDKGPGIPRDEQARLFVRFHRGTLAYRTEIPGTGLGLAACKAYAEAMGGEVWVESEPGDGSTFFLRLPHRPATEANSVPTIVAPDIMVGRIALVVDDHEFNRIVLSDLLGRMGAKAMTAVDVPEAQNVFETDLPDIVFVDFDLPGSNGADLARWIRTEARTGRDVPIVATSAFEVDEIRRKCVDAGMDGFIAKPVTPQKVAEVMSRIETLRGGGMNGIQAATPTPARAGFLDLLSDGDPQRRRELEHSAWREVLAEAMETFRGVRARDLKKTAQRSHRLVSSALMLGLKDVVASAREVTEAARADDASSVGLAAKRLRSALEATRSQRKD
ncbi:MAG: hybrid sensor histidine kinase/response regulator, partial [Opitutaceae bacterium]